MSNNNITCSIQFDHPDAIYYSGNTVNYQVTIKFEKTVEVKNIYLKIHGFGFAEWNIGKKNVNGIENYFKTKINIVGSEIGTITMEPGIYNYKSSEILPINLPMSLDVPGNVGYIRHVVQVIITYPFISLNEIFEFPFNVLNRLNLNQHPQLKVYLLYQF